VSRVSILYYEYLILNVVFFLAWVDAPTRVFPWFFIPMCLLAIPVVIIYMRDVYAETRWWLYLAAALVLTNLMFFLVWGFTTVKWPWFLLIWGPSGALVGFLWYKFRDDQSGFARLPGDSAPSVSPSPSGRAAYDNL